jgi:hypothetical protein
MMAMRKGPHATSLSQAPCQDDFLKKDSWLRKSAGLDGRRGIA